MCAMHVMYITQPSVPVNESGYLQQNTEIALSLHHYTQYFFVSIWTLLLLLTEKPPHVNCTVKFWVTSRNSTRQEQLGVFFCLQRIPAAI